MTRRLLLLTLLAVSLAATASAEIAGAWTSSADAKTDRIYLNLTRGRHQQNGNSYRLAELGGLTEAQVRSSERVNVQFSLGRDPGTIAFEGTFRNGAGAGQFTFTPNRSFPATLRAMNLRWEDLHDKGDDLDEQLYFLTSIGFSGDYIRSMQAEGFRGGLEEFVQMRLFGVTKEYIAEMQALGYKNLTQEKLVEARIHGVTPDFVRKTRAYGWPSSLDQLIEARIHGVTPEFADEMKKLGFADLSREKLVEARIHGVTADYVRKARAFGWELSLDKLIETRIHGATPDFAEEMKRAGYPNLSLEKLIEMRIFGVTAKFVRELAEAGYEKVPVDKLIEMRIHGIDAEYVRRMSKVR